jgi:hypothetical protein
MSSSAASPLSLDELRARFSPKAAIEGLHGFGAGLTGLEGLEGRARAKSLPLGLASVDGALPDGGLPRGAVIEVTSPRGLGRATSFTLRAVASAQRGRVADEGAGWGDAAAWCAWIDPFGTLYAPAAAAAGVELSRLLVVRPRVEDALRAAVRVASSRAFALVVLDLAPLPGLGERVGASGRRSLVPAPNVVRRLALAIEGSPRSVVLLTDASERARVFMPPLPVALRLELDRTAREGSSVRVAKERRGRVGASVFVPVSESA